MPAATPVALSPEEFVGHVARESWDLFRDHAVALGGASLLVMLLSGLTLGLATGTLAIGYILLVRRLRRGELAGIVDAVHFDHFVGGLLASVLVGGGVMLGLSLVVPGIALGVLWAFTFHAMAYQDLAAVSAMKASWGLVKAYFLHVLALLVALVLLNGVGSAIIFGWIISVPLSMVALTIGYELLTGTTSPAQLPSDHVPPPGDGQPDPMV